METAWWTIPLLVSVGAIAGALNVVAGGGSFLTLPVLIFLGLPPTTANGTNRVAIVLQNVAASWGFWRHAVLDVRAALWAAVPATVGSALGTWIALVIGDQTFQRTLAVLMVLMTLWTLVADSSALARSRSLHPAWLAAGFFVVGLYGGFVQAGVGFLILAVTSLAGLDLVRGNAVKVLSVLCFTTLSLVLFALDGRVEWVVGLVLAAGHAVGGLVGVKLTVLKGHRWVKRVVTVTIFVFAIQLLFEW